MSQLLHSAYHFYLTVKDTVLFHYHYAKILFVADIFIGMIIIRYLSELIKWCHINIYENLVYGFRHFPIWAVYLKRKNDYYWEDGPAYIGGNVAWYMRHARKANKMLSILKRHHVTRTDAKESFFDDEDISYLWICTRQDLEYAGFMKRDGDFFDISYTGKYGIRTVEEIRFMNKKYYGIY